MRRLILPQHDYCGKRVLARASFPRAKGTALGFQIPRHVSVPQFPLHQPRSFDFRAGICYSSLAIWTGTLFARVLRPRLEAVSCRGDPSESYVSSRSEQGREEISSKALRVNEAIRVPQVRVIDDAGSQLGILDTRDALRMADSKGMDLVEVAPNAEPPVCRVMDYGKFIYEKAKKEREARKAQKTVEVKEIRLRPKTGQHDIDFKLRDSRRWLEDGAKVKVRVVFRGREITHPEVAKDMMERIAKDLEDVAIVEQRPHAEGHSLLMILSSGTK